MKLERAAIGIAGTVQMSGMHPAMGGSVVAAGNGRGKTAVTAALAEVQAIVSGQRGTASEFRRQGPDLKIELRAARAEGGEVFEYTLGMTGGLRPRVAEERLRYGPDQVLLIHNAEGRGTWRQESKAPPELVELAEADGCALNVAGSFSAHREAALLKRWIERWKIDRWTPGKTPLTEERSARPKMRTDGRGVLATVAVLQEKQHDLFTQLRHNLKASTAGRLTDLEAIRMPDDGVSLWATVNGCRRVLWHDMPDGFNDAVRMEVRLLTSDADDLVWFDCPDGSMDDDLSAASARRVCALKRTGPQVVMLTRSLQTVERATGPNRYVVTTEPAAEGESTPGTDGYEKPTPRYVWSFPMAGGGA